jgi:predicted ester cyclase
MDNLSIVKGFVENVLNQSKFDELENYISSNYQTHSLHLNPKPVIVDNPPKTFKDALIQSQEALSEFKRNIDDIFSSGDKVIVRWTTKAVHIGNFMGISPTNKKITFTGMSIYRVVDGKITDEWYLWDRLGLYQQLGIVKE